MSTLRIYPYSFELIFISVKGHVAVEFFKSVHKYKDLLIFDIYDNKEMSLEFGLLDGEK